MFVILSSLFSKFPCPGPSGSFTALVFLLAAGVFSSCSVPDNDFSISGTLENAAGKTLYLYEMGPDDMVQLDSAVMGPDGTFSFTGQIDRIRFMTIRHENMSNLILIVTPGEDITLTADINNLRRSAMVEGSPESELSVKFNRRLSQTQMALDSVSDIFRRSRGASPAVIESVREETREQFIAELERMREYTIDFITRNPGSLASMMALYQQVDGESFILNMPGDHRYYELVDSALTERYGVLDYAVTFSSNVSDMKEQAELRRERESMVGPGTVAPEISLPDPEGDTVYLSSLRGNYVLLDFWASWCSECREVLPSLAGVYDKYGREDFEIYQVSLDRDRERWISAIEDLGLNRWIHVSDLSFLGSPVVSLYRLQGIPTNFLIDPEGMIIGKDLGGEELNRTLARIFD